MTQQNIPDFGEIKIVRGGNARTSTPVAVTPAITTSDPAATVIVPAEPTGHKKSIARFWWLPLLLVLGIAATVWGHNYYQARYVGSDYWAQVPATQDTTPTERISDSGDPTGMYGVEYNLTAFNEAGEQRELHFVSFGEDAASMPQPGAFIWLSASDQLVVSQRVVPQNEVPANVQALIAAHRG